MRTLGFHRLRLALVCALLSSLAPSSSAASELRAVIAGCRGEAHWVEAEAKIQSELSLAGIVSVITPDTEEPATLAEIAREENVLVAIRVRLAADGGGQAEVFIESPTTQSTTLKSLQTKDQSEPSASVLALRVVEFVIAETSAPSSRPEPEKAEAEESPKPRESESSSVPAESSRGSLRLGVRAGAFAGLYASDWGVTVGPSVAMFVRVSDFLSLEIEGGHGLTEQATEAEGQSASLRLSWLRAMLSLSLWESARQRYTWDTGGGPLWAVAEGEVTSPFEARTARTMVGLYSTGPSVRFHLGAGLSIHGAARAGTLGPRLSMRFGEEEVTRSAPVVFDTSLGFSWEQR